MDILNVKDFSVSYDGETSVVDHLSFSVGEGEILSIVGESGSGKSTMLHGILGLLPAAALHKGSIFFEGEEITRKTEKEMQKLRGEKISMIFQDTGRYLNPTRKIGRQFVDFLKCHRKKSRKEYLEIAEGELKKVHLHDTRRIMDSYLFELSGGMRQRVGIAMAMALNPSLMLADEPTSALDVTIQKEVINLLLELRRVHNTAIVMVTHNIGVAAHISDKIGVMKQGRLIEWADREKILSCPRSEYTKTLMDSVIDLSDERLIEQYE